jgi:hypothetical protein
MYSPNRTTGQWRAHGRYITRDSVMQGHEAAAICNQGEVFAPPEVLDRWQKAGHPRLWKRIISPEFGERIDLNRLTRDLMGKMEKDLNTRLEWLAVPHFNTEHPHVHVATLGESARTFGARTDCGRYSGQIIGQTAHHVVQRLSPRTAVAHMKHLLDNLPHAGDNVAIAYSNNHGMVRDLRERSNTQELGR